MTPRKILKSKGNDKEQKKPERSNFVGNELDFDVPDGYECPISCTLMDKPVITADGHSYNQPDIEKWFKQGHTSSPLTAKELAHTRLGPNYTLQKAIRYFVKIQAAAQAQQKKSVTSAEKQTLELKGAPDSIQPKQSKILLVLHKKQKITDPIIERLSRHRKLLAAVQCRNLEKINLLLKGGSDSHLQFEGSLLFTALQQPDADIFKQLLEAKVTIPIKAQDGYTVSESLGLFCSWPLPQKKAVLALLAKKNERLSSLHQAACLGEEKTLDQPMTQKETVVLATKDSRNNTVLHYAAANGQLKMLKKLNKKYPNQLSLKNKDGLTPLLFAALNGQLETVQWLLNHGASLTEQCGNNYTALLWAASTGQLGTVQWLLKNGASLTERSNSGCTALLSAALNGQLETMQWLLAHGASLRERSRDHSTALLLAAFNGHRQTVQWLLAHGASLTEKNNRNMTTLLFAAHNGQFELVQWLLAHGASLTEKNHYGCTALLLAAHEGHLELVQWLQTHGASLTETDERGNTALLLAVTASQLELTQWLLTSGSATLSETNREKHTVFDLAKTIPMQKLLNQILSGLIPQTTQRRKMAPLPPIASVPGRIFSPVRSVFLSSSSDYIYDVTQIARTLP